MISTFVKLLVVVVCGHCVAVQSTIVPFQFCNILVFSHRLAGSLYGLGKIFPEFLLYLCCVCT